MAQLCQPPEPNDAAVRPLGRLTATGVELLAVVPSPREPHSFTPQQYREASSRMAQVW